VPTDCSHLRDLDASSTLPDVGPAAGGPAGVAAGLTRGGGHLRQCLSCGLVGCCDSSPRRHATGHFRSEGHPVMRSAEPGESWRWCYVDQILG
jgi:uncharacterized UBP type Zn finger protein